MICKHCAVQLKKYPIIVVCMAFILTACGGGGGSSPPASSTLSGVAAVGYPIVNGTVQIMCAGGSTLSTTTSNTGAWQATIAGQTAPCAVEVSSGTVNGVANTIPYYSVATSFGTVNVTPFTTLMVANLTGTATPGVWFAGLNPTAFALITPTTVSTSLTNLRAAFSGFTPLTTINPITVTFTATSGNNMDDMLTALQAAMTNGGVSYTTLLSYSSSGTMPAGFGISVMTVYLTTPSGSTGTGGGGTGTGGGTGITFSAPLGGFTHFDDTHIIVGTYPQAYGPGALTATTGSIYGWYAPSGGSMPGMIVLGYQPMLGNVAGNYITVSLFYQYALLSG